MRVAEFYACLPPEAERLPPGEHIVTVTGSECREIKNGFGLRLIVSFADDAGRVTDASFLLAHTSASALSVARRRLLSLFQACGYDDLGDTNELEGKRLRVTVAMENGYTNAIKFSAV